ncbi:MAG: RHS repeat-associated core domain-containing protein [Limisphaerales bacterium]
MSLAGNTYAQDNGNLTVTLGGNGAGQWGQIATSGNALLSGALNLKFADGFIPPPSGQYVLVSAANLQGTFNTGNLPFGMSMAYSKTNATLIWNGITQNNWGMGNPALHGAASNTFLLQPGMSVQLIATSKGGTAYNLGTTTGSGLTSIPFNTALLPNGIYTLQAVVRNASGQILGDFSRTVFVNNSLSWHDGSIAASQTWGNNAVNAIDQTVIILNGATLTIAPGAVLKFAPGAGIVIETGGTLDASGATAQLPVIFTSLSDNSIGGISDENPNSVPQLGSWAGIIDSGTFKENSNVQVRYALQTVNGVITSSQEWLGATEYLIDGNLIVPTNVTLTIDPGTIVKFSLGVNMTIQAGGALAALGTEAQPITFTSVNDGSVGVDTNVVATTPAAGDWDSIYLNGGEATMEHVAISYGGGPDALNSGLISLIAPGSVLNISDSVLSQGFYKDINAEYGLANITNCVVTGTQRGIQSGLAGATTVNVVNCTVDNNTQYSLLGHGGVLNVWNTIVSASQGFAVYYCCGSTFDTFAYNDIWGTSGSDYGGIASQTGLNGNISVNPNYVNAANGNYQLNYGSPAINSADALVAPLTDLTGAPLYNDPRTKVKTGVPNSSGLYADMGAFNFEESAASTIDLIATNVSGPTQATAGQIVSLQWNDVNQGTGSATGPWHDTITLVPQNGGQTVPVATVLVAQNTVLGPGQSYAATAQVTVPGDQDGSYLWQVQVNSQGDVFEGANWTNNTTLAALATTLTVTNLSEGIAATNQLAAAGDYQWYAFSAPSNGNYTVTLSRAGGTGGLAIYVGQGFVPTAQNFDQMANGGSAGTLSVPINSTSTQPYYIAVYAASGAGAGLFTLSSTTPSPALTGVKPNIVGNAGPATLTITGGDLSVLGNYQIVDPAGTAHAAASVSAGNAGTVYATFNFAGLPLGAYGFQVNGGALKLANALTVTNATPGNLLINITGPALARPGREFPVIVSYTNAGGTDLPSPILYLHSGAGQFRLPGETTWNTGQYQILAINTSGGPVGVLPPGYAGQLEVECQPVSAGAGNCDYEVSLAGTDTNVGWAGLEQTLQPEGEPADAWGAIYSNFMAKIGTTYGQYQNVLAQDATYLGQQGETVASVRRLLNYEYEQADNFGAITKRYHLGAFGRNVADPMNSTATTDASGNVLVQCSGLTRFFALQPDGSYLGQPGDGAMVSKVGGAWQLREVNGITRAFLPSGALNYIEDNFNRITANYTGSQVSSLSDSFGNTITLTYNGSGRVAQTVDPVGRTTSYTYDAGGQHIVSATGTTGTTNFGWVTNQGPAAQHALSSITFPDGTHCYYQYDSLGRMTNQSLDGGAEPITYSYDNAGGMTATDATGRSGIVVLNEFLQTAGVQDDDMRFTAFNYDTNRQTLSINATLGADWRFVNDALGNRLEALDPLGQQTSFTYEPVYQHLTSVTDPLGHGITKSYDTNGSVVTETFPDGSSKNFQHDKSGNLIGWTSRRGLTTTLAYDAHNLVTRQSLADGSAQTFTYDAHRNLASFTDVTGTTSYTYDGADRLTGVTYPNGHSLLFAYNAAGLRTQMKDQSGFTLNYSYDGLSRLAAVSNANDLVVQYGYDDADRIARKTFGNGSSTIQTYAPSGLLQSITNLAANNSVVSSFTYSYDPAGRVTSMATLAGAFIYAYDADDQITSVTTPSGRKITYQYDKAGNRVSETDGGTNSANVVNNLNQYQWLGNVNLNYDQDGNLISRIETNGATTTYAYDSQNHLIAVTNSAGTWSYQYNALWQRTSVTFNGQTTQYDMDPTGPGSVVAEYNGGLVAHYVYGLDLASRVDASGNPAYYTFDGSGNTVNLTDANSATVGSYSYLPFGEKLSASSSVANPFTYVGELGVTDEGQGLYLMRNRWYDPSAGHFTQPDPADLDGGTVNLYQYAANNPVHRSDPNGLGLIATIVGLVTGLPANEAVNTANQAVAAGNANRAAQGVDYSDPNADLSGLSGTAGGNISGALQSTGHLTMTSAVGSANAGIQSTAGYPGITTPAGATGAAVNYGEGKMMPPAPGDTPWGPGANKFMGPGNSGNDFSLPPGSGSKAWNPPTGTATGSPTGGGNGTSKGNTGEPHSGDPNNKSSSGFGTQGYVTGSGNILYLIQFANETNAAAPAAEVTVTDQLDPNLDRSTFAFQNVAFNNVSLVVPNGVQTYTAMAQVVTDPSPVQVTATFNPATGIVTWVIESIDPVTRTLPTDPLAGFLPPDNTQGQGEGNVTYTVSTKAGLPNGTIIKNQAVIVFDANAPIATAITTNMIDNAAPSSSMTPLSASSSSSFTVSWSGKDTGPGIAGYDIFVATNGGVWTLWQEGVTNTSATFTGTSGNTYAFYSVAYDDAGLVESQPVVPGTSTTVTGGTPFSIAKAAAGSLTLTWSQGTLLQATNLTGPWSTNTAASPYTFAPTNSQKFFKLLLN